MGNESKPSEATLQNLATHEVHDRGFTFEAKVSCYPEKISTDKEEMYLRQFYVMHLNHVVFRMGNHRASRRGASHVMFWYMTKRSRLRSCDYDVNAKIWVKLKENEYK